MNPHRTDAVSLIFGIIFAALAGWWLLARTIHIGLPTVGWTAAVGLIVVGLAGLLAGLRGGSRRGTTHTDQSDDV